LLGVSFNALLRRLQSCCLGVPVHFVIPMPVFLLLLLLLLLQAPCWVPHPMRYCARRSAAGSTSLCAL
jgi:hypothetical protein